MTKEITELKYIYEYSFQLEYGADTIDVNRYPDSCYPHNTDTYSVEIFPENQSSESFENAEFDGGIVKIHTDDNIEAYWDYDYKNIPDGYTRENINEILDLVKARLLETRKLK